MRVEEVCSQYPTIRATLIIPTLVFTLPFVVLAFHGTTRHRLNHRRLCSSELRSLYLLTLPWEDHVHPTHPCPIPHFCPRQILALLRLVERAWVTHRPHVRSLKSISKTI